METLLQSGPSLASCCRITMMWISMVWGHLKWQELHPCKYVSHACTERGAVWRVPLHACLYAHSYELDKCQFLWKGRSRRCRWGRQTLVWNGPPFLWIGPVRIVCNPERKNVQASAGHREVKPWKRQRALWVPLQDLFMEHMFQLPSLAWLAEHCWLCYANDGRWISHFPKPGFAQLCIYYPPLKIQSP